jgi:hypothetical protein
MGVLGLFAFVSAVLIAWPALAYLGAKMFNIKTVQLNLKTTRGPKAFDPLLSLSRPKIR